MVDLEQIKRLRQETGCGVIAAKEALESAVDFDAAKEWLRTQGIEKAQRQLERETVQGWVGAYVHATGRVGSLVILACETDFVARTEDFKKLLAEIAMQVAAMNPASVDDLLAQEYIRDGAKKVRDLLLELSGKVGENIVVRDFKRLEIG